jgi:hypothetical protein
LLTYPPPFSEKNEEGKKPANVRTGAVEQDESEKSGLDKRNEKGL